MAVATDLNRVYLTEMTHAAEDTTLGRVRLLWWQTYLERLKELPVMEVLNTLDLCMDPSRQRLQKMAETYARSRAAGTAAIAQRTSQFLKSNTGKMFERFVGLALAHALANAHANYAIMPCRRAVLQTYLNLQLQDLRVIIEIGGKELDVGIDADLVAFRPDSVAESLILLSVKSTLKDRFHNVPFWNLLRHVSLLDTEHTSLCAIRPYRADLLRSLQYVAICSDLAAEQPDFASNNGPRSLLQIDAALLDGAFARLSDFFEFLCQQ